MNTMMRRRLQPVPPSGLSAILLVLVSLLLPGPSQSLSPSSSSLTRNAVATTTSSSSSVDVRLANLPSDLPIIRDCRRSAYAGKSVNLPAAKSFCEADQIMRDGYVCFVATERGSGGGGGGERVLGTADLNARTGVVNNVYVREEARKRGIARSMMTAVEDYYAAREHDGDGRKRRRLTLTVMSKNLPAVTLYKGLGYAAPGIYGGLDALSTMSPLNFLIEMEKEV